MTNVIQQELIQITAEAVHTEGMLALSDEPLGVILFAHGSGSGRFSPRNNQVASALREARLGTLLMDLLTPEEERDYSSRFDISLLTRRLAAAIDWLRQSPLTQSLPIGLFGASTGAAAALQAAAAPGNAIAAVVSRGGRPDLAGRRALQAVRAPTLLIVGGLDHVVIDLNQAALTSMHCDKQLEIVPGASHLFEEPGKLAIVSRLAAAWFVRHLQPRG